MQRVLCYFYLSKEFESVLSLIPEYSFTQVSALEVQDVDTFATSGSGLQALFEDRLFDVHAAAASAALVTSQAERTCQRTRLFILLLELRETPAIKSNRSPR